MPSQISVIAGVATVLMLAACAQAQAAQDAPRFRVAGKVLDQTGSAITGAQVTFRGGRFAARQATDDQGRFVFESVPVRSGTVAVRAPGLANVERAWRAGDKDAEYLEIVLRPEPLWERVTVTATRTAEPISETAASVTELTAEDLSNSAALTLDDALRQVPGFGLFRRSGSRTANPTSQGAFLRGLGSSGASRALVLSDGIPLNDPFGGWVYWSRIPRRAIDRIEIVRGGASELYGSDALGGVINMVQRKVDRTGLSIETAYGNERTAGASLFAGLRAGHWSAGLAAQALNTDGYVIVDKAERGRIDTPAGGTSSALDLTVERAVSDRGRFFLRGSIFGEARANGTPLQRNRTHNRELTCGAEWHSARFGSLSLRAFGGPQVFDQDFSAVALDRNSEVLTRGQRVPARQTGWSTQWSGVAGSKQTWVIGLDRRDVSGASDEIGFRANEPAVAEGVSGRQRMTGFFAEDILRLSSRWFVTAGARLDKWRNHDALATVRPLAQLAVQGVTNFPDRAETALSPRLSVVHKLRENVSLTAAAYSAFRAPTLNELYRSFRVGDVMTLANSDLRAERLTGAEAGARFSGFGKKLNASGTFFWNEITHPIANVTLAVRPELITRQRENLGRTRFRGVELDAMAHLTDTLTFSGGYQFLDAAVLTAPQERTLEGLRIPQVPRHQLTFQFRYAQGSRTTWGVQGRVEGAQFDDDQNRLRLERYFTLDARVSRSLVRDVEVFIAAENLLNQRYAVGRTPMLTVGPPLLVRFGARFRLTAHAKK